MTLWKNLVVALVAAFVLAACSSSDNDTGMADPPVTTEPPADEQIAELQDQINVLRAELGLDPIDIDELTSDMSSLQGQVSDLTQQIADRDKEIADRARMDMTAKGKAIFEVLDPLATTGTPSQTAIAPTETPLVLGVGYGVLTTLTVANQGGFVDGLGTLLTAIDAGTNDAFAIAEAGDPAPLAANGGFSGTMLTWADMDRAADTMAIYVDVSAPSSKLFSEAFGGGGQHITSADSQPLAGAQFGVTGTAFDGRTAGRVDHKPNAKSDADQKVNDVVKLPGSYMGAAGSCMTSKARRARRYQQ